MHISNTIVTDVFGVDPEWLVNSNEWRSLLTEAAKAGDYTVLDTTITEFDGGGLTGVAVLAESHLFVHTWPEHDYVAVTLESCKDEEYAREVLGHLLDQLDPDNYRTEWTNRYARPPKSHSD